MGAAAEHRGNAAIRSTEAWPAAIVATSFVGRQLPRESK
jgi:hypothetical protein